MPVNMATTSVPRWRAVADAPTASAGVVPGTHHVLIAVGPDRGPGSALSAQADELLLVDKPDASAVAALFGRARVGWRFTIVGAESDVAVVRAAALVAGAIDEEIECLRTDSSSFAGPSTRRVCCAHCGTVTVARTEVGGRARCAGCDTDLSVYYHFSLRRAAYLGFDAESEEL